MLLNDTQIIVMSILTTTKFKQVRNNDESEN